MLSRHDPSSERGAAVVTAPARRVAPLPDSKHADARSLRDVQHATRVSAVSLELLEAGHDVTVITSAPEIPFASILDPNDTLPATAGDDGALDLKRPKRYAQYRKKTVDAGMIQPKAYDVDRRATCDVLSDFLSRRNQTLQEEVAWLTDGAFDVVLSDSTFLGWYVHSSLSAELRSDRSLN